HHHHHHGSSPKEEKFKKKLEEELKKIRERLLMVFDEERVEEYMKIMKEVIEKILENRKKGSKEKVEIPPGMEWFYENFLRYYDYEEEKLEKEEKE
uniref:DerF7_binder2 n=1 Tax=synthetic construct TaxID=32630 RepID=UPI0038D25B42